MNKYYISKKKIAKVKAQIQSY